MTTSHTSNPTVSIIGAGKVGRTLARFLSSKGITVRALITEPGSDIAALANTFADTTVSDRIADAAEDTDFIFICVPDDRISDAAADLAAAVPQLGGKTIAHTSGLRTSEELAVLERSGALYGCLHPIQSFHSLDTDPSILNGIGCGVEGDDAFAARAVEFAEALGWKPLRIAKENKALYHAACVFAGNFLVALAEDAGRILKHATGESADMNHLLPMMEAVLARLHDTPVHEAVTGPAARGDHQTAGLHTAKLDGISEDYRHIYALWTRRIMDITGADEEAIAAMTDALQPPADD